MMPKECPKDKSYFLFLSYVLQSVQIQITDMAKTRDAKSFYEYLEQKNKGHLRDASTGILAKFKGHEYWSKSTCPFYFIMRVEGLYVLVRAKSCVLPVESPTTIKNLKQTDILF